MNAVEIMRNLVAGLPPDVKEALADVEVYLRARPNAVDISRGATSSQRGYFYGIAPEPVTGTEIPDDTRASGEIVVFAEAHRSALELERTLAHEIAHCTGHSEEEICEQMGLG